MAKRWRIHPHDPDRVAALARAAGIPAVVSQLLICRGIVEPDDAKIFLDPKLSALRDPELLPGCTQAAEQIHEAIAQRRRIVVYGDYDVDGMTGTAVLYLCLRLLGADVGYYIPNRIDEGYGLNAEAIRGKAADGTELIVTVDCGIASVEEADLARELGVELIVTDHHEPGNELPRATVVHPRLPGGSYPFGGLSGSGVALKLAWAICQKASGAKRVGQRMKDFLMQAVGLAAMGTVADMVPLVDENRVLVRHGLASVSQYPTLGIATLMKVTELHTKREISSEDVGFTIGPRLNAAGRLGQPQLAVELLVTDQEDRARQLADYIHELNENRQKIERSIQRAANKQANEQFNPAEDAALVLADRGWHQGVIGIVAGRLAEKYHRPVVLISRDKVGIKPGVGSGRSVAGFNLHAALQACDELLVSHGGHKAAAGLKIEEQNIDAFRAAFCELAAEQISEQNRAGEWAIDAEAPLSAFTLQTVEQIERLAPFGQANPRPLLSTTEVTLAGPPRTMGTDGHHLSLQLAQHGVKLRAVAFGGGEWAEQIAAIDGTIDVAFRPIVNTFRGRRSVELHLVDWKATGSAD